MNIIVIGSSDAGLSLAYKLKKENSYSSVTVIESDRFLKGNICNLIHYLSAGLDDLKRTLINNKEELLNNGINIFLYHKVIGINTVRHLITVSNLENSETTEMSYDKLIISDDNEYFIPNITGSEKMGVHTLNSIDDLVYLKEFIRTPYVKDIAILGVNHNSLSLAGEFKKLGRNVRIISKKTESCYAGKSEISELISCLNQQGVCFNLGETVTAFNGQTFIENIRTDKNIYECDLCVSMIGYKNRTPKDIIGAKITYDGEIIIDEKCETSVKGVYYVPDNVKKFDTHQYLPHNPCNPQATLRPVKISAVGKTLFGKGAVRMLIPELQKSGIKQALIITDDFLFNSGAAEKVGQVLTEAGVRYSVFHKVTPNPTVDLVNECLNTAQSLDVKALIALGGGSAIDTAKAVSIVMANGGRVEDYEGISKSKRAGIPVVAINTTAGTGSECTSFYIITDLKRHSKMTMVDENCMVSIAVNDIDFMLTMPAKLTASTGMDALTHAIEAVLSVNADPYTDKDALWAIKTISENLITAYKDGANEYCRTQMAYAENVAGMAFSNAGLGMVHAMAHALGGRYNLPHGLCNAILLPYVLMFTHKHANVDDRFEKISDAMGLNTVKAKVGGASTADVVIANIQFMNDTMQIPESLSSLNRVDRRDFEALAELAIQDSCMSTNPYKPTIHEIIETYENAYSGRL